MKTLVLFTTYDYEGEDNTAIFLAFEGDYNWLSTDGHNFDPDKVEEFLLGEDYCGHEAGEEPPPYFKYKIEMDEFRKMLLDPENTLIRCSL